MKKGKLDKASIFKAAGYASVGFGLGLICYQYLTDWMPLAAGVSLLVGVLLLMASRK
jgi:hypothetical protein